MTDRNRKEQLGVRVSPGVKQKAVDAAKRVGVSLNEWVERLILSAVGDPTLPVVPPPQTSLDAEPGALVEERDGVRSYQPAPLPDHGFHPKPFDANCSMREYHWKHGPGIPCRRCGGEV